MPPKKVRRTGQIQKTHAVYEDETESGDDEGNQNGGPFRFTKEQNPCFTELKSELNAKYASAEEQSNFYKWITLSATPTVTAVTAEIYDQQGPTPKDPDFSCYLQSEHCET